MERNLLLREIDDLSSSRQFFWRPIVIPSRIVGGSFSFTDKARIVKSIVDDSATELARWQGKVETDTGMYDVVKGYWRSGVEVSAGEASTIIQERKADIVGNVAEPRHPWSAAFVSYIMRRAYPSFHKSRAHNRYIAWAKDNRSTGAHPFQAFRVTEVAVEAGDIICFARSKKSWATYDNVAGKLTHGDIVTRVENGYAVTIGGNVNKNVAEKTRSYRLDSSGYLQQQYVTVGRKKLPRFIAIIKLLPYYEKGSVVSDDDGVGGVTTRYEVDQELSLPADNSSTWAKARDKFSKVSWDITPQQNRGESDEDYEVRKTTFINRIHGVLTRAKKDPADWFASFTRATFLGVAINNPIHVELATHLSFVENALRVKYGSESAAARTLGLSATISGGRGESATASVSMHTFGLAIDLEIHDNPYLGGAINFGKKNQKEKMRQLKADVYILSAAPKVPKKLDVLDVIFKRAGVLINGTASTYPRGYTEDRRLALYDNLKALNDLTIKYFNLVEPAHTGELAVLLKRHNLQEWRGLSDADAMTLIKKDYDWFRALVSRYSKEVWVKGAGKKKVKKTVQDHLLKEKGFLSLDRRLVEDLGLSWGAVYGDIMHFDMRNTGVGRLLHRHI